MVGALPLGGEPALCFDVAATYQRSSFPKAYSDTHTREWLVHFPRVESQLCACPEPRLGLKLADAELVGSPLQVSYVSGAGGPLAYIFGRDNPASGAWLGSEAKEMHPFLASRSECLVES